MSTSPLVSIVVPIYNVEKFLEGCLDTLVAQTYRNIEIICVNDGSPDGSEKIIDRYAAKDTRIKKINKINQGLNAARASGVDVAQGEYIMFVDSDDMILRDCVEYLLEQIDSSGADIAVGGFIKFVDTPAQILNGYEDVALTCSRDEAIEWLLTGSLKGVIAGNEQILRMTAWSKLYRASVVKGTDWKLSDYQTNEDELEIVQWYGAAKNGVSVSTKPVYYYRVNPDSKTQKKYSNRNPSGKEIDRFEFARDWRTIVREHLNDMRFSDMINQRFIWFIQNGVVKSLHEGSLKQDSEDIVRATRQYQKDLADENNKRLAHLESLRSSRSWRIIYPLRVVGNNKATGLLWRGLDTLRNPRKAIGSFRELLRDKASARRYKDAWVITDRPDEAADNGILFYNFLASEHPEVNVYYVLSKESADFEKLLSRGVRLVEYDTDEHRRLMKHAAVEASAFFNYAPFDMNAIGRKKPLVRAFIRHGIEQSDLSQHYARMGLDLYCDVLDSSRDFYKSGKSIVDISDKNIQVTGMPRYDLLRKKLKKAKKERTKIVLAPTWRRFLLYKPGTTKKQPDEYFSNSEYLKNYNAILNSAELKNLSREYEVVLIPHPEMLARIDEFKIPSYVVLRTYSDMGTDALYELALETKLFISDYSSTTFDFAFLGASVAYFNFDSKDYYSPKQELYISWFDIDRDGFGPSFTSSATLRKYLTSDKWIRRQSNIDKVWSQVPENSSELIYKNISELLEDAK